MRKILFVAMALLLIVGVGQAQYNLTHPYSGTVTVEEDGFGQVIYKWVSPVMVDSIGDYLSPPIWIGGLNAEDGYISGVTANVSGTEKVAMHISVGDKLGWTSITTGLVDLTGVTVQRDTVGITNLVDDIAFHLGPWMVLAAICGASNPADTYITVKVTLQKNSAYVSGNGQPVKMGSFQRMPKTGDTTPTP